MREHTATAVQVELDQELSARIRHYAERLTSADGQEAITARIGKLEQETDVERALEVSAATLGLAGTLLAAAHHRRWLWLAGIVTAFLLQHRLQGWCPPIAVFRRLGARTRAEIDAERYALKLLRGDFGDPPASEEEPVALAGRALGSVSRRPPR